MARASRLRRVYLRRGDCATRIHRRQKGTAALQTAVSSQFWFIRQANNHQQHGDLRRGALLLAIGPQKYLEIGKPNNGGTKIFSVSGDVELPGNYEAPLGTPFATLLECAGGM